jgi:hypothetical protein
MSTFTRVIAVAVTLFGLGLASVSAQDDPPSQFADLGLPEVKITVTDTGFETPDEAEAGLNLLTVDNQSSSGAEIQLLQLPEDTSIEDAVASLGSEVIPDWVYSAVFAGGVATEAGATVNTVVDLSSGDWFISDLQSAETTIPLKVTGDADRAGSGDVESDLEVTFKDHKIDIPDEVEAGPQIWEIKNEDDVPHIIISFYYPGSVTAEEVLSLFDMQTGEETVEPTIDFNKLESGPTIAIHSEDQISWVETDLKPGSYVMLCFSSDQGSDISHAENGMTAVFTVPGDIPTS